MNGPDHAHHPADALDWALLHASGSLTASQRAEFERRLASGDADLLAAWREIAEVNEAYTMALEPASPTPSVRAELMRRVAHDVAARTLAPGQADQAQAWRSWEGDQAVGGLFTLRAEQTGWEPTGVAGVDVRRLFIDRDRNRMTALFRMAPGTKYPEHRHADVEECYVLEGDLHVGEELVLRAGDYQRATEDSHHVVQWTQGGCTLLIVCALDDEWTQDDSHT